MYLPGHTLNLINLVRDKKNNIDGILNSIRNGSVGGNVVILNPHGIAIGKTGVVNVGSLMLSTPNKEFIDQVIAQDGSISELATKSVLAGDLPINPTGVISVKGKIKALDSVSVKGGQVVNTGEILANLKPTKVSDIVNLGGIDPDAPLTFKDGRIGIFAEKDVVNAGKIKADAGLTAAAGKVTVKAKNNIDLQNGSLISADGSSAYEGGGSVLLLADNRSILRRGATVSANAYSVAAEGGFVELSALREVDLAGGTMSAGGRNGIIFIDPEVLNISSDSAYLGNDNIYAVANTINVKQGVNLTKENGNITLIARDTDAGWVKNSSAFLNIEDNAVLKGKNVYLYALAGDAKVLDGIVTGKTPADNGSSALSQIGETVKAKGLEFFDALTDKGLLVGYGKADARAEINIGKNVTIAADEEVKINSKVVSAVEVSSLGAGIDVVVSENSAASAITVDSGSKISGKNVSIVSDIDSSTAAEAKTIAYGDGRGVPVDIAVAVGLSDTTNKIDIKNGSMITAQNDLTIDAVTKKSQQVSAEGMAYQDGWAAAGVAYSESHGASDVTVGGTIKGSTVNIGSEIRAVKNASSAKTTVGTGLFDRPHVWVGNKILDGLSKWITKIPAQTHAQSNTKLAMSGAVFYSEHSNRANVKVLNNYGSGETAADAGTTSVSGDKVTISAHVLDMISNSAGASVSPKTKKDDHSEDQNKENSFAGAVGYGVYDNDSYAEIGSGAAVNASQTLDVVSSSEAPLGWPDTSIFDVFDNLSGNLIDKGKGLLDNISDYMEKNPLSIYTSLVKSSANTSSGGAGDGQESDTGVVGVAGAVNIMKFNHKSDALISDGAQINQLYNPENPNFEKLDKAPSVNVEAKSYAETLNVSGEYGGAAKYGLGGSYLQTWYDSKVNAVIGDNVKLYAGNLDVDAGATHRNLSLAAAGGYKKADSFGFQGTFNWLKSDSAVLAQISRQADVMIDAADEKSCVRVNAESTNGFINIAGGLVRGSAVGMGMSGALNDITQNTQAVIGRLQTDPTTGVLPAGRLSSNADVVVNAQNRSALYAVSAAGTLVTQGKGEDDGKQKFGLGISGTASYNTLESIADAYINDAAVEARANGAGAKPDLTLTADNDTDVLTVGGGVALVKQSGTEVGIAGAVGINNLRGSRSAAFIDNARISGFDKLKVNARAAGNIIAAAESAAGAFGKTGVTIAGAVSVNQIDNTVASYIRNADLGQTKYVEVGDAEITANNSADIFALAGNISAASGGGVGSSVAVNNISNTTESYAKDAAVRATGGNVIMTAQNNSEIETSSAGVAYGGKAAVSGSVSVNNINNRTRSYADNSRLNAQGSVLVKSFAKSVINFYGGMIALSSKGIGGGGTVTANSVTENTSAEIRNGSQVTAYGHSSAKSNPDDEGVTGVGVTAANDDVVNLYGVNAGLGKQAGIGANVAVSRINNHTAARIDGSAVNADLSGGGDNRYNNGQRITVAASDRTRMETHAGTLGVGGTVGVGLSSVTTLVEKNTVAEVNASTVKSKNDIAVTTDAKTYFNSVVVGGAGGKVGVAGNVNVAEINNHNHALIDGSDVTGFGDTRVEARDVTRLGKRLNDDGSEEDFAVALGAGGVGLYNGTGASVLVSGIRNDTLAKIANSIVDTAKDLVVKADSQSSVLSYVFAAGLGIYSGVAGSVAVNTIDNTTEAYISEDDGKTTRINGRFGNDSQDVVLSAVSDAAIENLLGSAAGGLGSGGASVDVSTINGKTSAGTVGKLALNAGRDIDVKAESTRRISVEGIAGAGGVGTLAGAVSIVRVGSGYTEDMQSQTVGVLETVNNEISRNHEYQTGLNYEGLNDDLILSDFDRDVNREFAAGVSRETGTSAYIGARTKASAGRNLAVKATDAVNTHNLTGQVSGGGASAGASVSITDIRNAAKAYIGGNAQVKTAGNLEIGSLVKTGIDSKAMGGVVAAMFAAGGSVVNVNSDNTGQAYIGNGAVVEADNVALKSQDESEIAATAAGVNASLGGAAGASVAVVHKNNDVQSFIGDGVRMTARKLESQAGDDVTTEVHAIAGAAGVVSGEATYAESSIVSKLRSYAGKAVLKLSDGFRMYTSGSSRGNAEALGVNAGLLSVGASVAKSGLQLDNRAEIDDGAEISAADVYLAAGQLKADAVADSLAAAGALIGGNGATANTDVGGTVEAKLGDGVKLNNTSAVSVLSVSNTKQAATASAYRGGILAAGATVAGARGHLNTLAGVGALNLTADQLTIKAEAEDVLYAEAVSGSGGIISGAAAVADTRNEAATKVTVGKEGKNGHFDLKELKISAVRTVKQNGTANSVNASVVGASGARLDNLSVAETAVDVLGHTDFAVNDVEIKALNSYDKSRKFAYGNGGWSESDLDYNIESGSGGVIDAPAVISKTVIDNRATVSFGADTVFGRNLLRRQKGKSGKFVVSALNDVKAVDKAKLISGGVLAIADTVSSVDNRRNKAAVNLNGRVISDGDLMLTANSNADLSSEVYVNTYGVSGVAAGRAVARTSADNSVLFASDSYTMSYGDLYVYAGQAYQDYSGSNRLNSRVYLWNNTALPFSDPEVEAAVSINNLINVASGAVLRSGRDIYLTSNMGTAIADGLSKAQNPYNQLLSLEDKVFNGSVNNDSRIEVNGIAEAGVNNIQSYVIERDGRVKVTVGDDSFYDDDRLYHQKSTEKLYSAITEEIVRLKELRADYIHDQEAKTYYDKEIAALQAKLTLLGLYSENGGVVNTTVDYITLNDIYAQPGAINLNTEQMLGSGTLSVTSDASVTIENNSPAFMRVSDVIIPERDGGTIKLKGAAVTSDLGALKVRIAEKTAADSSVTIRSNIPANQGRAPNIDIDGTVSNYGGNVKIANAADSIYVNGSINGKNLQLEAGRDIYQAYSEGFRHIGGDPAAAWKDIASANESNHLGDGTASSSSNAEVTSPRSSMVAGNNIFLSGRYVNLNGLVQSGTTDYQLNINDREVQLAGGLTSSNALDDYNRNKRYDYNASPLYKLADKYGNIDAYYNVLTGQIELSDVRVEGGYVEIYGHILNTSAGGGEIMVADGFGRVNINNNSGKEMVVNNLSLSNRISGVIKITDLAKTNAQGDYLQTTYTRNGNQITVADNNGTNRQIEAAQDAEGKSSAVYSPSAGQRYVWTTGQKSTSETTKTYQGESFWGMDWLVPDTGEGITVTGPTPVGDPVRLAEGERIEISASDNLYEYNKDSYVSDQEQHIYHNVDTWSEGWWIFSVDKYKVTDKYQTGTTHVNTHSIKADYDVKVSFKGYDSALADIVSRSDIILSGVVNNQGGTTNIVTEGAVRTGSDYARILGQGLNITANNGIGADGTALAVDIAGGNLNVTNRVKGDVNLQTAGSDFVFRNVVNNGGNTSVFANGSIRGIAADSLISGRQINLTASTGSVGTSGQALQIQTSGDQSGALTVLAAKDVNLAQQNGDLGLNSVVSLDGDVTLNVKNGSVFDANTNEVYDNKTVEQLSKIWDDMGLDNGNLQMKEAFLNEKKAEYNAYWQYKSRQPDGAEPEFRFTAAEKQALLNKELNDSEKQAIGAERITEEYIARLEADKTAEYKKLAAVYGDEGKYGSQYDAGWNYQLSEAESADLAAGAGWNKNQLSYSIFKAKEGDVVDTQYMIEDPNIVGKKVTVAAAGSIGRDEGSVVIDLTQLAEDGDIDKKLLIASAERDNLEISEDGNTITVYKREDVDIHADAVNLTANGYIYLGGEQDININRIEAGADQKVTIAGAKGIYNVASAADAPNIIGKDLILEAADGSVGTVDKALNLQLTDGAKITARSQNDIFLNSTGSGDLVIDHMLAKDGVLNLNSSGRLTAAVAEGDIVNLQGQSIVVNATAVGSEDAYLTVALGDQKDEEHTLSVNAGEDVNISHLGDRELRIKSATAGKTLRLKSASDIAAADDDTVLSGSRIEFNGIAGNIGAADRYMKVSADTLQAFAGGDIYLDSQKSAVFEHLGSGGDTKIRSAENITLNDVRSDGGFLLEAAQNAWLRDVNVASALTVESAGKLTADNLDAGKTVTLTAAEADLDHIRADGDIRVAVDGGKLTVDNLDAGKTVTLTAVEADLDHIRADGDIRVAVDGANLIGALTSADGDIAIDVAKADANLRGTLKAGNGEVRVSAANSILNAGAGAEGAIVANTVDLTAQKGSVGTADNYLTVDSSYHRAGWINALAQKGIYIDEVSGPMNIRQFVSGGDIDMRVDSSVVGIAHADPALPHFKADNITLHSKGQIGRSDNPLVLALNNNRRGKINLQAGQGIAVRKLGDGLVSDYIYNDGRGKIWIELPSGHAHIADVRAVDGFELTIREGMPFYNIWLTNLDLEARMINPPYTEYPEENPIRIMSRPLDARYRLQLDRGLFLNTGSAADEEKLSLF